MARAIFAAFWNGGPVEGVGVRHDSEEELR
jgi:hypothetical protein